MTVTPEQHRLVNGHGYRLSHMAYQIGTDQHLRHRALSRQNGSGLLCLNDTELPVITQPEPLCREILRECTNRGYDGVCADFGSTATPDRTAFLIELSQLLQRSRKKLFLSSAYAHAVPMSYVLINTALSGGTLRTMLSDACKTFGADRVCLDIERVRMDFLLPSPTGEGTHLSAEAWNALYAEQSPSVYFSHELCAKYFTYQKEHQSHFVLFDDADTIRFKLRLGNELSLPCAFLLCSEVSDLLQDLRRRI